MIDLNEKFDLLNAVCFSGKLKPIGLRFKTWGNTDGVFVVDGEVVNIDISCALEDNEAALIPILLHEMVHYFLYMNNSIGRDSHDKVFKSKIKEVELLWGKYQLENI